MKFVLLGAFALALCGCSGGGVTEADSANMRAEFSQSKYEAAMKAAGKGAELEREKQAAAARGESQ